MLRYLFNIACVFTLGIFAVSGRDAAYADISTVSAVHSYVTRKWDVSIPYTAADTNVISMKYLMSVVDKANEALNGKPTSNYANDPTRATSNIASITATKDAVDNLISPEYKFFFTPITSSPAVMISAAGTFYVDWGDGVKQKIEKNTVGAQTFSHSSVDGAIHEVKLGGHATGYMSAASPTPVMYFPVPITTIRGCLGCVFSTLRDGSQPMFINMFGSYCSYLTDTTLPAELFNGIKGRAGPYMFQATFQSCTNLTTLPENLFPELEGGAADFMFNGTFQNCSGLQNIPSTLFDRVKVEPADSMFYNTFQNCSKLSEIPAGLFDGIQGAPADGMFRGTFQNTKITEIPENLFVGISGVPAASMFNATFAYTGITEIPEKLFAGLDTTGDYKEDLFKSTFSNCTDLTGYSPKIGDKYLYEIWTPTSKQDTFAYDTGLTDYDCMPAVWGGAGKMCEDVDWNFFFTPETSGIEYSFNISAAGTFYIDWGDGNKEKKVKTDTTNETISHTYDAPANTYDIKLGGNATDYSSSSSAAAISFSGSVFGTTGREVSKMSGCLGCVFPTLDDGTQPRFYQTFYYNQSLAAIPDALFGGVDTTGDYQTNMFYATFSNCTGLTGESAKINGRYLYEIWPDVSNQGTYSKDTGLTDYDCIPTGWGGAGYYCGDFEPLFYFKMNGQAAVRIGAAGTFYIDWGDGHKQKIEKNTTSLSTYSHTYESGDVGDYEIAMGGRATGYQTSALAPAVRFHSMDNSGTGFSGDLTYYIGDMRGCLGCIFPTLDDGTQPSFYGAFKSGTYTSLPKTLFDGVTGAPRDRMFMWAFYLSDLTEIPAELFSGLDGAPQNSVFQSTFQNTPITAVPKGLFDGIKGMPAESMFEATFRDCTSLKTIPNDLFAGINGAPAKNMYLNTFRQCNSLTGDLGTKFFGTISGAPAEGMYDGTFYACGKLASSIPSGLFGEFNDVPQPRMFADTFWNNFKLSGSIPSDLFKGITPTGEYQKEMFYRTFRNCSALTGPSAKIGDEYLYNIWEFPENSQTYYEDYGLTDWSSIPSQCK